MLRVPAHGAARIEMPYRAAHASNVLHLSVRRQRLAKGYRSPRESARGGKDLARNKNREQNHDGPIEDNGRDGKIWKGLASGKEWRVQNWRGTAGVAAGVWGHADYRKRRMGRATGSGRGHSGASAGG